MNWGEAEKSTKCEMFEKLTTTTCLSDDERVKSTSKTASSKGRFTDRVGEDQSNTRDSLTT